jgi:hypothetical protein
MRRNEKHRRPSRVVGSSSPSLRPPSRKRVAVAASVAFLLAAVLCGAQQTWEGNAASVRRGTFASPGLFAASNSFPRNSQIEVQELASGRTVQVTVVQRIQETDGIFLLLSEEAAAKLGLSEGEVIRVKARVVPGIAVRPAEADGEQAFNPDPDINPAAELKALAPPPAPPAESPLAEAGPAETSIPEAIAEPGPPPEETPLEEPPLPAVVEPGTPTGQEGQPSVPQATQPAGRKATAEQERLSQLQERLPRKQVFQPPRQGERFALEVPQQPEAVPEAGPAAEEEEPAVEEPEAAAVPEPEAAETPPTTEEPQAAGEPQAVEEPEAAAVPEPEAAEIGEAPEPTGPQAPRAEGPEPSLSAPEQPEEALVLRLPSPRPLEPERPEAEGTRLPAPEQPEPPALAPELPPVELPPEVAQAPVQPEVPPVETVGPPTPEVVEAPPAVEGEAAVPPEPALAAVAAAPPERPGAVEQPLGKALTPKSYFLQVGAYSSRTLAEKLARGLGPGYEISILPVEDRSRTVYRVLIGPLNTDESGTLLYLFKARGFKDAFLRYVE